MPQNKKEELRELFVDFLIGKFRSEEGDIKAADLEVVRKCLTDPAFTFESVKAGNFGDVAQAAAEEFPFDDDRASFN